MADGKHTADADGDAAMGGSVAAAAVPAPPSLLDEPDVAADDDEDDDVDAARQGADGVGGAKPGEGEPLEDDDAEDEVVGEVPVYVSQELAHQLYVLQYPLRPATRSYESDMGDLTGARVKPAQKRVELEYSLDPKRPNYDDSDDHEHRLTAFRVASKVVPPKTNYAVGVFKAGALHLTPVHAVCRMRPSFEHLDEHDKQRKAQKIQAEKDLAAMRDAEARDDLDWKPEDDKKAEEPALKQVVVKMKRKETDKSAAFRKLTHNYLKSKEDAEPWVDLKINKADTAAAMRQIDKLVCAQQDGAVPMTIAPKDFLSYINPLPPKQHVSARSEGRESHSADAVSLPAASVTGNGNGSALGGMSSVAAGTDMGLGARAGSAFAVTQATADLVLMHLKNAHVVSFAQICVLTDARTAAEVSAALDALERYGHLVQGNWVISSNLLYKPGSRVNACRDCLIHDFAKNRIVSRELLAQTFQLDVETMNEVFTSLGTKLPDNMGWEFRLPTDDRFISCFPEVVHQQNVLLRELYTRARFILLPSAAVAAAAASSSSAGVPGASAGAAATGAGAGRTGGGGAAAMDSASGSGAGAVSETEQRTRNALYEFFESRFRQRGVMSRPYLDAQFRAARESKDPGNLLRHVEDAAYNEAVRVRAVPIGSTAGGAPERLVRRALHLDRVDKYRAVAIQCFCAAADGRVRKPDLKAAVDHAFNGVFDATEKEWYAAVMAEFAVFGKGVWTLKSGEYS